MPISAICRSRSRSLQCMRSPDKPRRAVPKYLAPFRPGPYAWLLAGWLAGPFFIPFLVPPPPLLLPPPLPSFPAAPLPLPPPSCPLLLPPSPPPPFPVLWAPLTLCPPVPTSQLRRERKLFCRVCTQSSSSGSDARRLRQPKRSHLTFDDDGDGRGRPCFVQAGGSGKSRSGQRGNQGTAVKRVCVVLQQQQQQSVSSTYLLSPPLSLSRL